MITNSSDTNIADWVLKLDQRVGSVVLVRRAGLAAGTEVRVVADCTLVSVTLNICRNAMSIVAKRTIAVDAMMASFAAD